MQDPLDKDRFATPLCLKGGLKCLAYYVIAGTCGVFMAAAMFRVLLYLLQEGKGEFLLFPLCVLLGCLFVYEIGRGVLRVQAERHTQVMERLNELEAMIMDKKLEEIKTLKAGSKNGN